MSNIPLSSFYLYCKCLNFEDAPWNYSQKSFKDTLFEKKNGWFDGGNVYVFNVIIIWKDLKITVTRVMFI